MTEHRYTVVEVDCLRALVKTKLLFGRYRGYGVSWQFKETDLTKMVEERVRTHMLAGHTADDLLASEPQEKAVPE